jgi:hypothetical protein
MMQYSHKIGNGFLTQQKRKRDSLSVTVLLRQRGLRCDTVSVITSKQLRNNELTGR